MRTAPAKALPPSITSLLHATDVEAVAAATRLVADLMQSIHGGSWRVQVDHEVGIVLVRPVREKKGRLA